VLVKELWGMLLAGLIHGTRRIFVLKVCELNNKRVLGNECQLNFITPRAVVTALKPQKELLLVVEMMVLETSSFLIIVVFPFNSSGQDSESEASMISEGYYVVAPTNIPMLRVGT
jgi:hypothetical protein